MSQGPSQVSSGHIAPKIVGPQKDTKEVVLVSGLVLFLGGVLAAAWYYGQNSDHGHPSHGDDGNYYGAWDHHTSQRLERSQRG